MDMLTEIIRKYGTHGVSLILAQAGVLAQNARRNDLAVELHNISAMLTQALEDHAESMRRVKQ